MEEVEGSSLTVSLALRRFLSGAGLREVSREEEKAAAGAARVWTRVRKADAGGSTQRRRAAGEENGCIGGMREELGSHRRDEGRVRVGLG